MSIKSGSFVPGFAADQWENHESLFLDNLFQPDGNPRWQIAQKAEREFWLSWRKNPLYRETDLVGFWRDVLKKTDAEHFSGTVLDIGCGPVPALNFIRPDGVLPIGIDPLASFYAENKIVESQGLEPITMLRAGGETIPFADESFDWIFCFNVLDHVHGAPKVLDEMFRLLKPGGEGAVYVHTFTGWIRPFLFWDKPHVYHWTHQQFIELVQSHGFEVDHSLKEPKTFDIPEGLVNGIKHFPYWVASHTAFTTYVKLQKQ